MERIRRKVDANKNVGISNEEMEKTRKMAMISAAFYDVFDNDIPEFRDTKINRYIYDVYVEGLKGYSIDHIIPIDICTKEDAINIAKIIKILLLDDITSLLLNCNHPYFLAKLYIKNKDVLTQESLISYYMMFVNGARSYYEREESGMYFATFENHDRWFSGTAIRGFYKALTKYCNSCRSKNVILEMWTINTEEERNCPTNSIQWLPRETVDDTLSLLPEFTASFLHRHLRPLLVPEREEVDLRTIIRNYRLGVFGSVMG